MVLGHINVTNINKKLSEASIETLYQGLKYAYIDGQSYVEKNLTLQGCVDWLSELDEK